MVAAWAVWERRVTFGSRIDSDATKSIALFGIGAALDSPWPEIAAASYPLTGRYYVLTMVGHLCYIIGAALVVKAIYLRLLPDDAIGPFMRKWIAPLVIGASAVMVISFAASGTTSRMPAAHLYLFGPDGWLTVYLIVHFSTTTLLGAIAGYGVYRLRPDPRAVMLNTLLAALMAAAVFGGLMGGWGVITGRIETPRLVGWLLTYTAFAVAMGASAVQWRHRVRALLRTTTQER